MLNKAQDAAANSGKKTTRSLVSAIEVKLCLQILNIFNLNNIILLVRKTPREFFTSPQRHISLVIKNIRKAYL